MSQKKQLLHEVLQEDQEPFHLKKYIQARNCRQPNPKPYPIQFNKRNPIRKNTCFLTLTSSPAKSPAALSPCRASPGNGSVFLHVPAKTASLLLEAALRIQKQNDKAPKPGSLARFGLFGSLLKRLTQKNSKKVKGVVTTIKEKSSPELDCFASSSGRDSDDRKEEEEEIIGELIDKSYCVTQFCESPFRLVLSRSSLTPESRTPEFSSPATSPARRSIENQEHSNVGGSLKFQAQGEKYEEEKDVEEKKDQCSPVSVLDPPFEDGDDDEDGPCDDDQTDDDDGFDLECSYANVQRAKKQLLRKLRKFEKLAGLDPVELERRMMDQDDPHSDNYDASGSEEESECGEEGSAKVPRDMKRLVSDVIGEQEREASYYANGEMMTKRVCKRFESWKDVECNTIGMMMEMDFRGDLDQWKTCREQVEDAVLQIELGVFGLLMEELAQELVVLTEIQ